MVETTVNEILMQVGALYVERASLLKEIARLNDMIKLMKVPPTESSEENE